MRKFIHSILIGGLFLSQAVPSYALRAPQPKAGAGAEELSRALVPSSKTGFEEFIDLSAVNRAALADALSPVVHANISFSGLRLLAGDPVSFPTDELPQTPLTGIQRLILARFGYQYAISQIRKANPKPGQEITFVLARDTWPHAQVVLRAQMRGMLLAANEQGVKLKFVQAGDAAVLPTPFVAGLVRMTNAHGGVNSTASHNNHWAGSKYNTAAREPGGLVQGGVLLRASEMGEVINQFNQWASNFETNGAQFANAINGINLDDAVVQKINQEQIVAHMVAEQRAMWNLSDEAVFESFKRMASQIGIVVDANGGAAAGYYEALLEGMGFQAREINAFPGAPQHALEPVDAGLDSANAELRALSADPANPYQLAVVVDMDADRGNTVILRRTADGTVDSYPVGPQEVAAFNAVMALSQAKQMMDRGELPRKKLAVVVHNFASPRFLEIAKLFDAEVFFVETGEVNVVEMMRRLEQLGDHWVVSGHEPANGGSVFRGIDGEIYGDTSRSGVTTALVTAMALAEPSIIQVWFERLKAAGRISEVPENPSLWDIISSLPGDHQAGHWAFSFKLGKATGVTPDQIPAVRRAAEQQLRDHWPTIQNKLNQIGLLTDRYELVYHKELEQAFVGPDSANWADLQNRFYPGAWTVRFYDYANEIVGVLGLRASATDGSFRTAAEARGNAAVTEQLYQQILFDQIFNPAVTAVKTAAGQEETLLDLPALPSRTAVTASRFGAPAITVDSDDLFPADSAAVSTRRVGVLAGSYGDGEGLAYGLAIRNGVRQPDGSRVLVIFVARTDAQEQLLRARGVHKEFIFSVERLGEGEAIRQARAALNGLAVEELGVESAVSQTIEQLLGNLGITLSPEELAPWTSYIRDAVLAMQA